ncbi:DUF1120 domain-containing protein [uncultured Stenotrophomonas sp.]|uniref:DUF1120 domain-containing protein n=1 Tax=uncultured Stenotrophomonas sp. TaxID=165438 RepID=UPI0028E917C9|nr:DUF1120 domain-containing protein [uncultured Stenotrophomonas sp.]
MNFTKTLFALALVATAPAAFAQSADLSVAGKLYPGTCSVDLGNAGVADFGDIRSNALNADQVTLLDPVTLPLTVACDGEVRFAFEGVDNASSSSTQSDRYGLGFTAADEKIGNANLFVADVTADGVPGYGTRSDDNGITWGDSNPGGNYSLAMHDLVGFAKDEAVGTGPAPIENLQGSLKVWAQIQPTDELTITEDVQINGSASLNIVYL